MAKKRNRITAAMSQTIAESSPLIKKTTITSLEVETSNVIIDIQLTSLQANPYQPRIDINIQSLNELISSIEQNGLLQPIIITEKQTNGMFTIIAGHRRYEAYKIMGKSHIQAIVIKDIEDKDLAILSLTENLMRENLHPIENAIAMKNILDNNLVESQNKLAEYVGLSKGYISKLMNILKLPTSIIQLVKDENYKDINILVLLNKLSSEKTMLEVYNAVKKLTRFEAQQYIKNLNSNTIDDNDISIAKMKITDTKISLSINLKILTDKQKSIVQEKIDDFNNVLDKLSKEWII